MCISSSSRKVRNIVKSFTLFTVIKALLTSNIRMYMVKSLDVVAISAELVVSLQIHGQWYSSHIDAA